MKILKRTLQIPAMKSRYSRILLVAVLISFHSITLAQWTQVSDATVLSLAAVPHAGAATRLSMGIYNTGIWYSTDAGSSWTLHPNLSRTEAHCIIYSDTSVFIGTRNDVIFWSPDQGTIAYNIGLTPLNVDVNALAWTGTRLIAGRSDGRIQWTSNNGSTWILPDSGLNGYAINCLAVAGSYVFAGTGWGVLRSTDGGMKWFSVSTGLPDATIPALAVREAYIYAATWRGVYVSEVSPMSWRPATIGFASDDLNVVSLAVSDDDLFAGTGSGAIYVSTNSGTIWTPVSRGLPIPGHGISALAVLDTNLLAGGRGLWRRPLSEIVPPPRLEPPTAIVATETSAMGFVARWSSAGWTPGFYLDVATDSAFVSYVSGYQNLDVGNATSRAVTTGLMPNTSYYYRVRAISKEGGESGNSNTMMVTTKDTTTVDIFPLAKNMQRIYAYGRGYTDYGYSSTRLDVDSGTVAYLVLDSTRTGDTARIWTITQSEHLIHHHWGYGLYVAYDTTYSLDTTVIVTLYEDLRGLHEIGCDSRVWSFSHWGIGDHPYRQWLDTTRTVYQTDYNNWAVERLYFDRNRGLYRRDYSKNTLGNTHYSLSIRAVLLDPLSDVPVRDFPANATDFTLFQNFPNPFNPTTVVSYQLPAPSGVERSGVRSVRLVVYDILGRDVAMLVNEKKGPGRYQVRYDASGLSSGVYIYRLTAGKYVESRRMVPVR